jgi:5'(3')-deoxyribonucleotidase
MNKKILYIDMDGVVANFDKKILSINPSIGTLTSHAPNYEERFVMVEKVMVENPRLFTELEPIEGSIEAVKRLWKHYDIYFLSTPCWMLPESYTDKRLWIGQHFGEEAKDRLILSQRKDLCIGDYLVDDRTANGAGEFTGKHIYFGYAHSVFPTWVEVETYLMNEVVKEILYNNNFKKQKK